MAPLAEKLNCTPWHLLWLTPYTQLVQFVHVFLRAADVWTVPKKKQEPEKQTTAEDFDELLGDPEHTETDVDELDELLGDPEP